MSSIGDQQCRTDAGREHATEGGELAHRVAALLKHVIVIGARCQAPPGELAQRGLLQGRATQNPEAAAGLTLPEIESQLRAARIIGQNNEHPAISWAGARQARGQLGPEPPEQKNQSTGSTGNS